MSLSQGYFPRFLPFFKGVLVDPLSQGSLFISLVLHIKGCSPSLSQGWFPLEKGTAASGSTAPPLEKGSDITPEPLEKGAGTASGKAASGKGNSSFWL